MGVSSQLNGLSLTAILIVVATLSILNNLQEGNWPNDTPYNKQTNSMFRGLVLTSAGCELTVAAVGVLMTQRFGVASQGMINRFIHVYWIVCVLFLGGIFVFFAALGVQESAIGVGIDWIAIAVTAGVCAILSFYTMFLGSCCGGSEVL